MKSKQKSPISRRLREARLDSRLSQKTLGIKSGIDEFSASARMNQYEADTHVPDYNTVKRIANVLKLPAAYFYCDDNELAAIIKQWSTDKRCKK